MHSANSEIFLRRGNLVNFFDIYNKYLQIQKKNCTFASGSEDSRPNGCFKKTPIYILRLKISLIVSHYTY